MKKLISMFAAVLLLVCSAVPAFAAGAPEEVSVVINSPTAVEDKPVYETDLDITVTNTTDHTLNNLVCYLSIVDVDRGFSYNVDEFGANAYQTRPIVSLAAGASASVVVPVKVTYVGQFKFLISAVNLDTGTEVKMDALVLSKRTESMTAMPVKASSVRSPQKKVRNRALAVSPEPALMARR